MPSSDLKIEAKNPWPHLKQDEELSMDVGQCYFLSDPAQQFQGRWQDKSEVKPSSHSRAQAQLSGSWPGTQVCHDRARNKWTYRNLQYRMGLKRAWTHEQSGWMEPLVRLTKASWGPQCSDTSWNFQGLSLTFHKQKEMRFWAMKLSLEFTTSLRTSLDVSHCHPLSFSVQPRWR